MAITPVTSGGCSAMAMELRRPREKLTERDNEAIDRSVKERRPKGKKTPGEDGRGSSRGRKRLQPPPIGESDLGSEGKTPVLRHHFHAWKRLSMARGHVLYSSDVRQRLRWSSACAPAPTTTRP